MQKSYKAMLDFGSDKVKLLASIVAGAVGMTLAIFLVPNVVCAEPNAERPTAAYQIQPGDVLTISVWKEPDLQSEVLVRPDGGLSFPLAGDLNIENRSVAELQQLLTERLVKYIPDPVVTIAVKLAGGSRIYVLGKVNRPGEYPLYRPLDVMQALSLAGGTTPFAALSDIEILRRDGGKQRAIPFRYGDVEKGRALDQNVLLKSGDTVVVP